MIRIIDTLTHTVGTENPPEELPPFITGLKLVILLKSGEARGRNTLKILPELPAGQSDPALPLDVYFEGEEKGQNIILDLQFNFRFEGLHWFHIFLDEEELTALPIRVKYQRVMTRAG